MLDEAKADPNLKLKISITAASIFCSCRVICVQAADKTHIENEKQPRGLITTRMDPAYWITKSIHHVSWAARGKRWAKRRHARLGLQDSARGRSMIERLVIWHGVTDRSLTDQYWPMALQPRRRSNCAASILVMSANRRFLSRNAAERSLLYTIYGRQIPIKIGRIQSSPISSVIFFPLPFSPLPKNLAKGYGERYVGPISYAPLMEDTALSRLLSLILGCGREGRWKKVRRRRGVPATNTFWCILNWEIAAGDFRSLWVDRHMGKTFGLLFTLLKVGGSPYGRIGYRGLQCGRVLWTAGMEIDAMVSKGIEESQGTDDIPCMLGIFLCHATKACYNIRVLHGLQEGTIHYVWLYC